MQNAWLYCAHHAVQPPEHCEYTTTTMYMSWDDCGSQVYTLKHLIVHEHIFWVIMHMQPATHKQGCCFKYSNWNTNNLARVTHAFLWLNNCKRWKNHKYWLWPLVVTMHSIAFIYYALAIAWHDIKCSIQINFMWLLLDSHTRAK